MPAKTVLVNAPCLTNVLRFMSIRTSSLIRHRTTPRGLLTCELSGTPFLHAISYRDKVPSHLVPKDSEIEALKNAPAGTILSGEAAKAASKMSQSFEDRRYLVGHMFFSPDRSRWHFFCFDQRDLRLEGNHWEKGSHVHFVNWLWPKLNADSVWSNFVNTDDRPALPFTCALLSRRRMNA